MTNDLNGLHDLPEEWVWTTIDQLTDLVTKGSSPNWQGFQYQETGVVFVRSQNVGWGNLDLNELVYLPEAFNQKEKKSVIRVDDVLLNIVGASIGRCAKATTSIAGGNLNQAVAIIRLIRTLAEPDYLVYYLLSPDGQQKISQEKVDVARANLSLADIKAFTIPVAPLPEQQRIVTEIEKQFTRLDAGVAALRRAQANLKRYKAAVLKAACEGKLVEQDPSDEPASELLARILTERRAKWEADLRAKGKDPQKAKYEEPKSPDLDELPELPKGWCWATLPQLGELARGKSKHRPRNEPRLFGGPYPFIQTGEIRQADGVIRGYSETYSEFGLAQSRLWQKGTLCITIAANIAETAILGFDACFPDSVVGFVADETACDVRFVEFFIRTAKEDLERYAPATAQKNINLDILQKLAVPLPPLAEQHRIVAEVERRLSVVQELEGTLTANLARAERLRQSILKRAFEGRLVPQMTGHHENP